MTFVLFLVIIMFLIIFIFSNNKEEFSILNPLPNYYNDIKVLVNKTIKKKKKVCSNYTNFSNILKCMNPFYPIIY